MNTDKENLINTDEKSQINTDKNSVNPNLNHRNHWYKPKNGSCPYFLFLLNRVYPNFYVNPNFKRLM
jgi:hypothetical protein